MKGSAPKCYIHMPFMQHALFMSLGATNTIGSLSQNKHHSNTSNKNVKIKQSTKSANYLLKYTN